MCLSKEKTFPADEHFTRLLCEKTKAVEQTILSLLPEEAGMQRIIMEAMTYSVGAGGKRLRPLLIQESAAMFGWTGPELPFFMAAMEMIHTYSLVHDDLPAMDNDLFRRGKKTTHAVYGEDMGILAGDALLNYAYETAIAGCTAASHPERGIAALSVLAKKAGIYGMIGGQVIDVRPDAAGSVSDQKRLEEIYLLKTGALLEASLMIGALLAGAGRESVRALEASGRALGMAFQIQDDILDVTGVEEELGKPLHSDERNNKLTYVSLYGMERAKSEVSRLTAHAVDMLEEAEGDGAFLKQLFLSMIRRRK